MDCLLYTSGDDMVVAQQKAQQTLSDLGESILTTLTPAISNFSDMISSINDTWNSLSPEAQNAIVTIGEIVVIIGTMIGVLSTLQKGIMAVNFVMMANPAALVIADVYKRQVLRRFPHIQDSSSWHRYCRR